MDGILVINKSKGLTSNDIVKKVKKILNTKVGHTGTLDPNATGVLPLLLGNATKISKYLINHDKEYEAVIKLGAKTTTADVEGKIIEEKEQTQQYLMTTGSFLQGYTIERYLGIVSGQVVVGSGFLSSFEASLADLSGTEASGYTDKLDLAKEVAQKRAVYKSVKLGGNALIGVDVEYTTFTNDLMSVIFTGTSVLVRRDDKSE